MKFSFKTRILLAFALILSAALFFSFLSLKSVLNNEILSQAQEEAVQELGHITLLLKENQEIEDAKELQAWLKKIGTSLGVRLTFITYQGKVQADSAIDRDDLSTLDSHAGRPEVVQAQDKKIGVSVRFSNTLKKKLIYAARDISTPLNFADKGFLRIAKPFSDVQALLRRIALWHLLIISGCLAAAVFSGILVGRQLNKALKIMTSTAQAIGEGDYSQRIRSLPGREFSGLATAINAMALSIENHIQTMSDQKSQLEAVLNGMKEGVMVLDFKGRLKKFNQALGSIFNLKGNELGKHPIEIVRSAELQNACQEIFASSQQGQSGSKSLLISTQAEKFYDVNLIPMLLKQSDLGAIVVFHEITELKKLERVRQDFVANVSHELRTPLTSIKGYVETLLESEQNDPEIVRSFMQIVVKNTNSMARLIEDLLQLSKLESVSDTQQLEAVNVQNALEPAWRFCSSLATEKNIRLENRLSKDDIWVYSKYDQLVQVLRNLLENALKYSPENESVEVYARDKGDKWVIGVQDNGPGVSRKDQGRIFERFYRSDFYRNESKLAGTGLGLAICRHIIRNHKGRIWLQSPVKGQLQGTVFLFSLNKYQE